MTSSRVSRTVVSLASVFFGLLALAIWAAPDLAARQVGVEPVRAAGTAMLRADFGGLFTPEQAAHIANEARVRHLAFYQLLPAPDNALARRVFANGVDDARRGDWTITDDGSLYTMPIGTDVIRLGRVCD